MLSVKWLRYGALAALTVTACGAQAKVTISRVTYHGWNGAYRMSNGVVELVYVPQIGRIMRYAYQGGKNVLWENPGMLGKTTVPSASKDWSNFGGDKLWPAPQERWSWPPDPYLDGAKHTVTVLPGNRLRVESPTSPKLQIRFVREITMAPLGTAVAIRNTMVNTGKKRADWTVWEIAQVDDPQEGVLPAPARSRFKTGIYEFPAQGKPLDLTRADGEWRIARDTAKPFKIGVDSPAGWVEARWPDRQFRMYARFNPAARYPDQGCGQEIYTNPDPLPYMELELLHSFGAIPPGGTQTLVTRWELSK